jgi:hypothetical protein
MNPAWFMAECGMKKSIIRYEMRRSGNQEIRRPKNRRGNKEKDR